MIKPGILVADLAAHPPPLEEYTCRHGLGYTLIRSVYHGIAAQVRYFVPMGQNLEVWQSTVVNAPRSTRRSFPLFSAVEFCLWDAHDDATNLQRNYRTGEVEVVAALFITRPNTVSVAIISPILPVLRRWPDLIPNAMPFSAPYRGWDHPQVVAEGGRVIQSRTAGSRSARITSTSARPGRARQVIFLLGYQESGRREV